MPITLPLSAQQLVKEIRARYGKNVRVDWVGDPRHKETVSDHNPDRWATERVWDGKVHAIDVFTCDIPDLKDLVEWVVNRSKQNLEHRLKYVIFNRRIARLKTGWVWQPYTGTSPHTDHAHLSFSYIDRYENDGSQWLIGYKRASVPAKPNPNTSNTPQRSKDSVWEKWVNRAPGSRVNYPWQTGSDIEVLQRFLGGITVDGYYGKATQQAVKKYQAMRGLIIIDGVAGPETWKPILGELKGVKK